MFILKTVFKSGAEHWEYRSELKILYALQEPFMVQRYRPRPMANVTTGTSYRSASKTDVTLWSTTTLFLLIFSFIT